MEFADAGREYCGAAGGIHGPGCKTIREVASLKLSLAGLAGFEDFYPSEISGGMRNAPPSPVPSRWIRTSCFSTNRAAGLDPISAKLLDDLILELRETLGTTIVIVTHELASIFAIGNNSVFLDPETKTMLTTGDPNYLRDHSDDDRVRLFLNRGVEEDGR